MGQDSKRDVSGNATSTRSTLVPTVVEDCPQFIEIAKRRWCGRGNMLEFVNFVAGFGCERDLWIGGRWSGLLARKCFSLLCVRVVHILACKHFCPLPARLGSYGIHLIRFRLLNGHGPTLGRMQGSLDLSRHRFSGLDVTLLSRHGSQRIDAIGLDFLFRGGLVGSIHLK